MYINSIELTMIMYKLFIISIMQTALAFSQSGTSTITGTIHDRTASLVPHARVKVVHEQTGATQTTRTNETGIFRAPSLLPGSYRIEVEADGFQKLVRGSVPVEVGETIALDLVLQLGKASET